jgi:DNA-binding SARP family transcriptional activator
VNPDDGVVADGIQVKFKLRLLGYPALVAVDGNHVTGLGPGKPLAMLAYLAVRGEARRDELVDLLWGEVNETNARNAFRQALHRLRSALGEELLPMDRDRVELNGNGGLEADRDAFSAALDRGAVAEAIEAYGGDFLDGFELGEPVFDGWVEAERTRLKSRFQVALKEGAEAALSAGRWLEALRFVQRLTTVAPYVEGAALLEANVLVAAGRGSEALVSLRRYVQTLKDQLDLQPSAKLREVIARIERADVHREPSPAARVKDVPFVGRELEIATLMSFVRGMAAERGGTVTIDGPPGIGKSRLVAEFIGRARALGPLLVLRGRERPTSAGLPYASVAEALRSAVRAPGVGGTGRHLLSEAARILPELRDSFDLPDAAPIDAEGGRLRFFEGIAALIDSVAYEQPVCLVLDDMQHASPSTLDLVGYLSARLQTSPVLIVLVYRGDGAADAEPVDEDGHQTIHVGSLEPEAVERLVTHIVDEAVTAGPLDVRRVAAASDGNPLRAIELARRALKGELPSADLASLRDILWSRLQRASPSQRRVFFATALLHRGCSLRLLAAAAHLPELATFEAAQELDRLGLLRQEGDSYVVAHDITTGFVAEMSGMAGRALLAGWAADALAAEASAPSDELATLYAVAGQQSTAFAHARRAAYTAAALGSRAEMHRLVNFALAVAPDHSSRSEAEAMLAAIGAGKKLLVAPSAHEDEAGSSGDVAEPVAPQPDRDPRAAHAAVSPARQLITPRLLVIVVLGVLATVMAVAWRRSVNETSGSRSLRDSLLVAERGGSADGLFVVTGSIADASESRLGVFPRSDLPAWARNIALPWMRPSESSKGVVAAERMTESGTDVYLLPGAGVAPVPVAVGGGIDAILGWSPDGGSLLVRRSRALPDGAFDADLWAFQLDGNRVTSSRAVDESPVRSVEEASWSPDGSRIAWVAQTSATHQRDVFVSLADGTNVENLTDNPGEDYHIAWSSNGNLLAFTSDRSGNPDLFAIEFDGSGRRLWRLTNTPAPEDFASFSPDNRFVAFQSTAGGDAAVYIMASLGGVPTRVTPSGGQFSIAGWRGRPPVRYADRLRIIGPSSSGPRDSIVVSLFGADPDGNTQVPSTATVRVLDPAAAKLARTGAEAAHTYVIHPLREGPLVVIASIPGWRADTLSVEVGGVHAVGLSDNFSRGLDREVWLPLGSPRPFTRADGGAPALFPNADIEWQSGVLSRHLFSLTEGFEIGATMRAPFTSRPAAAAQLAISLVGSDIVTIDSVAPQLHDYVAIVWDGEASRFTYSVGAESKADPISSLEATSTHRVGIALDSAGNVRFVVDGRLRWTSSLRFLGNSGDGRARLWLGGRATGSNASISSVVVKAR